MRTYYVQAIDGREVQASVALDATGTVRAGFRRQQILEQGEHVGFNLAFCDSARATPSLLRDAAGEPARLVDQPTGAPVQLTDALITAIGAKAVRLGVAVERYLSDHLRYAQPGA